MAVLTDGGLNLRTLPVAAEGRAVATASTAAFTLGRWTAPRMEPGEYGVFVSVGEADGTPRIELPLKDGDGRRRYRLGKIRFERKD